MECLFIAGGFNFIAIFKLFKAMWMMEEETGSSY
jgi:hypothetical protein